MQILLHLQPAKWYTFELETWYIIELVDTINNKVAKMAAKDYAGDILERNVTHSNRPHHCHMKKIMYELPSCFVGDIPIGRFI